MPKILIAWFLIRHCITPMVFFFVEKWGVVFVLVFDASLFQFILDFCKMGEDDLHLHHQICAIKLLTLIFPNVLKTLFLNCFKQ